MWEVYSLGKDPYLGWEVREMLKRIQEGDRLEKPQEECPAEIYKLMLDCWDLDPKKRPTFEKIFDLLNQEVFSECSGESEKVYLASTEYEDGDYCDSGLVYKYAAHQNE